MPKVYVTQLPHQRDVATGALVPRFNLGPAQEHGDVVVMMPPQAAFQATSELTRQISERLSGYEYADGDSVLLLGDTIIIAASVAVLAKHHGKFTVLKWDRNLGRYIRSVINP